MTPKKAWGDIQEYIPKNKVVWEAFYGDGRSGQHLTGMGLNVIHEQIDFFAEDRGEVIVTNPPFSKTKKVMERLFELDKPFILILPVSKLNAQYFRKWKNKIQIIIPQKRIHFDKKVDGETPKNWKKACNFDCFYYCYKIGLDNDITWLEEETAAKPPVVGKTAAIPKLVQRPETPAVKPVREQCSAMTKKNKQCKNKAKPGSTCCARHQPALEVTPVQKPVAEKVDKRKEEIEVDELDEIVRTN